MADNVLSLARKAKHEVEWRLCKQSLSHFYYNHWKVETIGKGYSLPQRWRYQEDDIALVQQSLESPDGERHLRLKARQIGFTTLLSAALFWRAFFYEHSPSLLTSVGEDEAKKTLRKRIKEPYIRLPGWMKARGPALVTDTTSELGFSNGSSILSIPSTESAASGDAVLAVMMDEAAFVGNSEDLFAALDPLCYGPMWIVSTANGIGNFFHDTWIESLEPDSIWQSTFHPWWVREERDEEWYNSTKRKYRKRLHLFYQEYPSNPEEAFSKSGNTVFDMDMLRSMEDWSPAPERFDLSLIVEGWYDYVPDFDEFLEQNQLHFDEDTEATLHVWQRPYVLRDDQGRAVQKPNFAVAVDTAEGLEGGDYTTIAVLDLNTGEYVATLRGHPPIETIGPLAEFIAYWYFTALLMVERNNTGISPLEYLYSRAGYPRLYRRLLPASVSKNQISAQFGWHTTRPSKTKMVVDFQAALNNEVTTLHDERFKAEAASFIHDGRGGFGASGSTHDDMVIVHLIAWQGYMEQGAYPIQWVDDKKGPTTLGDLFGKHGSKNKSPFDKAAFQPIRG